MIEKIAVLGAGSWGTALAYLFSKRVHKIDLWSYSPQASDAVSSQHSNERYLPGVQLPDVITCTANMKRALEDADCVVLAVPSFAVESICRMAADHISPAALVLSGAKGLESSTGRRLSEVVEAVLSDIRSRLAVLSGPNLAQEAARGLPTATVVASYNPEIARSIQQSLSLPQFRIYTNSDVIGVELGGALKNIIAIAAGISDGLGYGENTKAALVSRGLTEIRRLGRSLGAQDTTFSGLSGIGDLYATCASAQSRNHRVGYELGRGRKLSEILGEMDQTAEGVPTIQAALLLARRTGVDMPITASLHSVVYDGANAAQVVMSLLNRTPSCEVDG